MVSIDFNRPIDFSRIPEGYTHLVFLEDGICETTLPGETEEAKYNYICFSTQGTYAVGNDATTYLILYNPKSRNNYPEYVGILSENPKPNLNKTGVQIFTKLVTSTHPTLHISIRHGKVNYYLLYHNKLLLENGTVLCSTHIDIKYPDKPSYIGFISQYRDDYIHIEMCDPSSTDSLLNGKLLDEGYIEDRIYNPKVELDYPNILPDSDNDSTSYFTTPTSKLVTVIVEGEHFTYILGCPFNGCITTVLAYIYSLGKFLPLNIYIFPDGLSQTVVIGESCDFSDGTPHVTVILRNKNIFKNNT